METKQRDMDQLQEMENEFKHLTSQQELINQQLIDLNISKEAILELKKTKQDTEILTQVANGIFVKTKLVDGEKFIVNIGASVTSEKTGPEIVQMVEKQAELVSKNNEIIEIRLKQLSELIINKLDNMEK